LTSSNFLQFRILNKAKLKAVDIVPPQLTELKNILKRAEFRFAYGADVVVQGLYSREHVLIIDDDEDGDSASEED
jgi:hypothetical protein